MRRRIAIAFVLLLFALAASVCGEGKEASRDKDAIPMQAVARAQEGSPGTEGGGAGNDRANANGARYQVVKETYAVKDARNDIILHYPQIVDLRDTDRQERVNVLIRKDEGLLFFLHRPDGDERLYTVRIDYTISWQSDSLLSIVYTGHSYAKGAPYPPNHFDTINIDIARGSRIRLSDLILVDEAFVERFRNEDMKTVSPHRGAISGRQVFVKYTPFSRVEDTVSIFSLAGEAGAAVNFYLTPTSLGISGGVAHAIGDHAEFEIKYEDIRGHIRFENPVWKDFFPQGR